MNEVVPVITVDGPGAAGKGTLSRLLASRLNFHYLDSGALYRLLALKASATIEHQTPESLAELALTISTSFEVQPNDTHEVRMWLDGKDVTEAIRTEEISRLTTDIALLPEVRAALMQSQRTFRCPPGLVADGRDMGTVVFPDALLKVFLSASLESRAERRYKQLQVSQPYIKMGDIIEDMRARDEQDSNRAIAPLKSSVDALVIDSTGCSVEMVLSQVEERALALGLVLAEPSAS